MPLTRTVFKNEAGPVSLRDGVTLIIGKVTIGNTGAIAGAQPRGVTVARVAAGYYSFTLNNRISSNTASTSVSFSVVHDSASALYIGGGNGTATAPGTGVFSTSICALGALPNAELPSGAELHFVLTIINK